MIASSIYTDDGEVNYEVWLATAAGEPVRVDSMFDFNGEETTEPWRAARVLIAEGGEVVLERGHRLIMHVFDHGAWRGPARNRAAQGGTGQ